MTWTPLARLLAILTVLALACAAVLEDPKILLLALPFAASLSLDAIVFQLGMLSLESGALTVSRELPELGQDAVAWSGTSVTVKKSATLKPAPVFLTVLISELLPSGLKAKNIEGFGALWPGKSLRWQGRLELAQSGIYKLPGHSITAFSALGLFHSQVFIHQALELKVYPNIFGFARPRPSSKELNQLLALGPHRLRVRGGSGELLELRDYRPGDPLKQMAWKLSARRDRLIVRELEREVPVRTWLVLDGGSFARFGAPGERALDALIQACGQLARVVLDSRDPVGLLTLDCDQIDILAPALGQAHLFRLLRKLAEFSSSPPQASAGLSEALRDQLEVWMQARFPRLMEPDLNPEPALLWPALTQAERRRRLSDRQLAAAMACALGAEPAQQAGSLAALANDPQAFAELLSRFARRFGVNFQVDPALSLASLEAESRARSEHWRKISQRLLLKAVDHELYVFFLAAIPSEPKALLESLRLIRARGHKSLILLHQHEAPPPSQDFAALLAQIKKNPAAPAEDLYASLAFEQRQRSRAPFLESLEALAIPCLEVSSQRAIDATLQIALNLKDRRLGAWK